MPTGRARPRGDHAAPQLRHAAYPLRARRLCRGGRRLPHRARPAYARTHCRPGSQPASRPGRRAEESEDRSVALAGDGSRGAGTAGAAEPAPDRRRVRDGAGFERRRAGATRRAPAGGSRVCLRYPVRARSSARAPEGRKVRGVPFSPCGRGLLKEASTSLAVPASSAKGVAWPAVPHPAGATMLPLQFQLGRTQWWTPDALRAPHFGKLRLLVEHAILNVPHYRHHLERAGLRSVAELDEAAYRRWPLLRSRDITTNAERLMAARYPKEHGGTFDSFTSGATGTPKKIRQTEAAQLFVHALVLRDHLWHARDFTAKFGAIRFFATEGRSPTWSRVTSAVFETGAGAEIDVTTDVPLQLDWLLREKPAYLLTSPSNLRALLAESERTG